jgi:hypothetical protein
MIFVTDPIVSAVEITRYGDIRVLAEMLLNYLRSSGFLYRKVR